MLAHLLFQQHSSLIQNYCDMLDQNMLMIINYHQSNIRHINNIHGKYNQYVNETNNCIIDLCNIKKLEYYREYVDSICDDINAVVKESRKINILNSDINIVHVKDKLKDSGMHRMLLKKEIDFYSMLVKNYLIYLNNYQALLETFKKQLKIIVNILYDNNITNKKIADAIYKINFTVADVKEEICRLMIMESKLME